MIPGWLHVLSIAALVLGFDCALYVAADVVRHPQAMWIMDVVWPVVALFGTVIAVWAYRRYGRLATREARQRAEREGDDPPGRSGTPFAVQVGKGAAHCGAGCTLGDIVAEWLAFLAPAVAVWAGWHGLFGERIFAVWVVDYVFAFAFGIAFQYFTIVPMRDLGPIAGLWQAVKADAASLTAWQVGMYGFMAVAHFWIFGRLLGARLEVPSPEFWFMMQVAMLCGFVTAWPVNWWLLKRGLKEAM